MGSRRLVAAFAIALLAASLPAAAAESRRATRRSAPRLAFVEWNTASSGSSLNVIERNGSGRRRIVACCVGSSSWASDGSAIAYDNNPSSLVSEIRIVTADGRRNTRIVAMPIVSNPQWSPDRKHIAFEQFVPLIPVGPGFYGENHILVVNSDGSEPRIVAAGSAYNPRWSPDSSRLAYENAGGIYVAPIMGAPQPTRVSPVDVSAWNPSWAPDGRTLAFLGQSVGLQLLGAPDLYVAAADGGTIRNLGIKTWCCASWSPDARRIVYATSSPDGNASGISVVDVATGRVRRLTTRGDWAPQWSPDGREIAFVRDVNSTPSTLVVMRPDGSSPRAVVRAPIGPFAWSRR